MTTSERFQPAPITFKGRTLGITVLAVLQILIGVIHVFFGFLLLSSTPEIIDSSSQTTNAIYCSYTIIFGFAVAVLAIGIWFRKKVGFYGTIATSLFVITVDSLALLDLPSIPGIPKAAASFEIIYSLLITAYLLQRRDKTEKEDKLEAESC
jgi:hypothetical protein